jgi:hypothetical protein
LVSIGFVALKINKTMHIPIHTIQQDPFDQAQIKELIDWRISHKTAQCLKSAGEFETLIYLNEALLFNAIRYNIQEDKILKASFKLLLETVKANFDMAQSDQDTVTITLANQVSEIKKVAANPWLWYGGYYYSFIGRSSLFRKYLNSINYQKYLNTNTDYDLFNVHHRNLLAGLELQKKEDSLRTFNLGYKYLSILKPKEAAHLKVYYPLWEYVIKDEQDKFNEHLAKAIEEHQILWASTQVEPDLGNDPVGHRNVYLTGIMAYAQEKGFAVEVSSDYTPQYLVEGNVRVDIDTSLDYVFPAKELSQQDLWESFKKKLNS